MLRYDVFYLAAALLASPIVAARLFVAGTRRTDWRGRFGHVGAPEATAAPAGDGPGGRADPAPEATEGRPTGALPPTVLVHGVSVGEVAATRRLVDRLADRARVVVSSTTDTGMARALSLYGTRHPVVRYPLDLSWMVRRFLDAVRPDAVVLVELEVWPNLVAECTRRGVPVCVVNGRLSASSHRGYARVRRWVRPIFRQLAAVGAQNATYARRFAALGVPRDRVRVTDTMKWDISGRPSPDPSASGALATALGLDRTRPLVVAGSTGPGEERKLIAARPSGAQLLLVPRRPERFDAVAALHPGIRRRSDPRSGDSASADIFLLDAMGELETAYGLADVAIVGRSFTPMGGSDPIPPVAAGCATVVGPHHENFSDVVSALEADGGIVVTASPMAAAARLIEDAQARRRMARNGRRVIEEHRGASARSAELVLGLLPVGGGHPRRGAG